MPKEIKVLCDKVQKQAEELGISDLKVYENKKEHQQTNTECGMYSIFMISNVLTGKMKPSDFAVKRISDEFMMKFRKTYFKSNCLIPK